MSNTPSSWGEVTILHRIVHHTFLPVVAFSFGLLVFTAPAYIFGWLSVGECIALQYAALAIGTSYIALLGNYVMPAETYRKYRSGEWGDE